MKDLKMLGLAVVAAAALMALVGTGTSSAAGVLCSAPENPCAAANRWPANAIIQYSQKPGTSATLEDTSGSTLNTCTTSGIGGKLTSNAAGGEATGENTSITWGAVGTACTFTTDTTKLGKLKINSAGGGNGTVIADEEIKVTVNAFGSCEYGVKAGTTLGTLNDSTSSFEANAVAERLNVCLGPATTKWTVTYTRTMPAETTRSFVSNG